MSEKIEDLEKELLKILDREKWISYASGRIEGALNVLYAIDLGMEERQDLLSKAAGICHLTAKDILEKREKQERIYNSENLWDDDKDY